MKIWIDLTNSPHVNFFAKMIEELKKDHEVILTCRRLANTIDLLNIYGFSYSVVGRHYGQNSLNKMFGYMIRIYQLYRLLKQEAIEVAISHSSFYSPLVARLLRVRSIYLNDNEHAAGNRISFLFADLIMVPELLDVNKVQKQWGHTKKIIKYPGVKEGIYLWQNQSKTPGRSNIATRDNRKLIFIRPEPWTAQYYKGKRNFIDDLLIDLKDICEIVLLPRGQEQGKYYRQEKFAGIVVPQESYSLSDIMQNCDLFIGAGGTMTREAAVLGIPTISTYQDRLLDVDTFLINKEFMVHQKDLDATFVIDFLKKTKKKHPSKQLLKDGKEAYNLIITTLLNNCK